MFRATVVRARGAVSVMEGASTNVNGGHRGRARADRATPVGMPGASVLPALTAHIAVNAGWGGPRERAPGV